jgi:hypothetical protein
MYISKYHSFALLSVGLLPSFEYDMYAITQYFGHEVGKELFNAEKFIRSYYKLEEYTLDSERKSRIEPNNNKSSMTI